jgi:hypothetical protein
VVIDQTGDIENARRVAAIIECTRIQSRTDEGAGRTADVTVILGRDFDGRICTPQP